jgi:demethylmenaquinone methyltransferase/2-methoxy-6-polyprenyl-1,4-benzoquinol methylase
VVYIVTPSFARSCEDCYNVKDENPPTIVSKPNHMSAPNIEIDRKPTPATSLAGRNSGTRRSYSANPDATLIGEAKYRYVSGMFARIAAHYDFMNALMTFGKDAEWRRYTVKQARPRPGGLALDVATGTGRIAQELAHYRARAVGIDFSEAMMRQGFREDVGREQPVYFAGADALSLPFADSTFECVTSGFAMRNVVDIEAAFREMCRVVKPGGRVVCLEVGRPRWAMVRLFHTIYTRKIVPLLGKVIAGDADAYTYLPNSMRSFPPPKELAHIMRKAGLRDVRFKQLTLGVVAVHVGVKREA